MPDYGNKSYWDERYAAGEEFFDWHQSYVTVCEVQALSLAYDVHVIYQEWIAPPCMITTSYGTLFQYQ